MTIQTVIGANELDASVVSQEVDTIDLRGFGKVSAKGQLWNHPNGESAFVEFSCQDNGKANILASKYLADMLAYGAVKLIETAENIGGTTLEIRHGGIWLVGILDNRVVVASAPTEDVLRQTLETYNSTKCLPVESHSYPPLAGLL